MNTRVFMPRESDVAYFAGLPGIFESSIGAFRIENSSRVLEPNDLMMLDQINVIDAQTLQRQIQLPGRFFLRPAVDLRHQESFIPIAVEKRLSHAQFAFALEIIPRV